MEGAKWPPACTDSSAMDIAHKRQDHRLDWVRFGRANSQRIFFCAAAVSM